jgi:hypothetical protein
VTDLPRDELLLRAQEALDRYPGAEVRFKFTCEGCGERCMLAEPNMLRESGICWRCQHETEITEGGFAVLLRLGQPFKRCPYCGNGDHHLCWGAERCPCDHTADDQMRSNERYHEPPPG